jgi:hypothetical protein
VTATTTEDQLFEIMTDMFKPLDDFHVSLTGRGAQRFSAGTPPPWLLRT